MERVIVDWFRSIPESNTGQTPLAASTSTTSLVVAAAAESASAIKSEMAGLAKQEPHRSVTFCETVSVISAAACTADTAGDSIGKRLRCAAELRPSQSRLFASGDSESENASPLALRSECANGPSPDAS